MHIALIRSSGTGTAGTTCAISYVNGASLVGICRRSTRTTLLRQRSGGRCRRLTIPTCRRMLVISGRPLLGSAGGPS
eukprot:15462064-Alexandrium_andersonii.AAC.1